MVAYPGIPRHPNCEMGCRRLHLLMCERPAIDSRWHAANSFEALDSFQVALTGEVIAPSSTQVRLHSHSAFTSEAMNVLQCSCVCSYVCL